MGYDRANSGTLSTTQEKWSENSPDFYGRLQISGEVLDALNAGKPIRIAGWNKKGQYGEFISLKLDVERPKASAPQNQGFDMKAAEQRESARLPTAAENRQAALAGDFDDDIPF